MSKIAIGKYMIAELIGDPKEHSRRHPAYEIQNKKSGDRLGLVAWYFRWKRMVFEPTEGALFDAECLRALAAFIEGIKEEG